MSRGRLGRYSLWQFRDFAVDRGIAVLLIGVLLGYVAYLAISPVRASVGPDWGSIMVSPISPILDSLISQVITLTVLIALNGIISNDRKMGYYRFLFSKPVKPVVYYAQLFAVHLVGVLLALALLTGLFRLWVAPIPISAILLYALVVYLAMGGIGFFVSAITSHDWVILIGIWLGSRILRAVYGAKPDFRSKLVQLLPPVHRIGDVAASFLLGRMPDASDVTWLVGYGLLFFALGLLVIHQRSMVD